MSPPVRNPRDRLAAEIARFNRRLGPGDAIHVWPSNRGVGIPVKVKIAEPGALAVGARTAAVRTDSPLGDVRLSNVIGWGC